MGYKIRQFLPDKTYSISSKTVMDLFRLVPSKVVNRVASYWLIRAARKYEIEIISFLVMSNHFHFLLRAPKGNISRFMQLFKAQVARELNREANKEGTFWAKRFDAIEVVDDGALLDRVLYTLCNPAKADLVETVGEWPGVSSAAAQLQGQPLSVETFDSTAWKRAGRPANRNSFRKILTLELYVPRSMKKYDSPEGRKKLRKLVLEREEEHRKLRQAKRKRVLGRRRVLQMPVTASSREVDRSPAPPCHASTPEARQEYLVRRAAMLNWYCEASARYRAGEEGVEFPPGTFPPWKALAA